MESAQAPTEWGPWLVIGGAIVAGLLLTYLVYALVWWSLSKLWSVLWFALCVVIILEAHSYAKSLWSSPETQEQAAAQLGALRAWLSWSAIDAARASIWSAAQAAAAQAATKGDGGSGDT